MPAGRLQRYLLGLLFREQPGELRPLLDPLPGNDPIIKRMCPCCGRWLSLDEKAHHEAEKAYLANMEASRAERNAKAKLRAKALAELRDYAEELNHILALCLASLRTPSQEAPVPDLLEALPWKDLEDPALQEPFAPPPTRANAPANPFNAEDDKPDSTAPQL